MHEDARSFLSIASAHAPCFVGKIEPYLDVRLETYLYDSIAVDPGRLHATYGGYAATALHFFLTRIQAASPCSQSAADDACAAFATHAIMQQADHSGLLLDTEILLNNALHAIACKSRGLFTMITLQCSTVKCVTRLNPIHGPAYLRHENHVYKVFNQSKRTLKDTNVCCLPGGIEFWLRSDDGRALDLIDTNKAYATAEDAFLAVNDLLWRVWHEQTGVGRVAVDERYTSELTALHLEDRNSPIYRLLFDENLRDIFLRIRDDYAQRYKQFVPNVTDFFWLNRGDRLLPMRLGQAETYGGVDYTPQSVATALRAGRLYSDKYIAYMVRSLLPGIHAIGGTSQQDYMALFQKITIDTHHVYPFIDSELIRNLTEDLSRLGGRPLLEPGNELQDAFNKVFHEPIMPTLEAYLSRTLGESIGTLDCASYLVSTRNPAK